MVGKVGIRQYKNSTEDKNCGMFEYEILEKTVGNKSGIFILNGMPKDEFEVEMFCDLADKKDCYFVLTDYSLAKPNEEIIKRCKKVFHSSLEKDFSEKRFGVEGTYSFIPNCYMNVNRYSKNSFKNNMCIFGGSFGGSIVEDSNFSEVYKIASNHIFLLLKNNKFDSRLNYENYLKLIQSFMYCLCLKRESYEDVRWVTPRFLDAISNFCMPIVYESYDLQDLYRYDDDMIFSNACQFESIFEKYKDDSIRNEKIEKMIELNLPKTRMFEEITKKIS